jgi:hypothetical protein
LALNSSLRVSMRDFNAAMVSCGSSWSGARA